MTRTRGVLGPETLSQQRWIDLPYASVIRPNAAYGVHFRVRLTGNVTLEPPLNGKAGQRITLYVEQDGAGGRSMILHAGWATVGSISISTTANSVTIIEAMCSDAVAGSWRLWQTSTSASATSAWPVGSIFLGSVMLSPAVLLGFGTWSSLGSGSIAVGAGSFSAYVWERTA